MSVNKSTTDDAASSSNIQPEFCTAGIDNDKPTDMELDEVASEGTAGEESCSDCNSNDWTNQSKTMKERMAEISEDPKPTSNHNDTKHANATSLDIGLLPAECPSNADIGEYVIRCHIGLPNTLPKDKNGQEFPQSILICQKVNGELHDRDWLVWSEHKQSLYCFPCRLFASSSKSKSSKSALATPDGYPASGKWRKLGELLPGREWSNVHRECYLA